MRRLPVNYGRHRLGRFMGLKVGVANILSQSIDIDENTTTTSEAWAACGRNELALRTMLRNLNLKTPIIYL